MYPILNNNGWIIVLCLMISTSIIARFIPVIRARQRMRKQKKHFLEYKAQRRNMVKM